MPNNQGFLPGRGVPALVSTTIPCCNSARIVREPLDSVCAQRYANFEVILIDDGSTDNSREVVFSYGDRRIGYFYKANGGPSAAWQLRSGCHARKVRSVPRLGRRLANLEAVCPVEVFRCDPGGWSGVVRQSPMPVRSLPSFPRATNAPGAAS
jgi:cellulose synthase/poly-beta-1,6-N-acetylglucosamine synthase-like glycosyltransferase